MRIWVRYRVRDSRVVGTISFPSAEGFGIWVLEGFKLIELIEVWEE